MYNLANVNSWHGNMFFPVGLGVIGILGILLFVILLILLVALKGYALWTSAKRGEKWWFVIMLVVNTFGVLELIYLCFIAKKWCGGAKLWGNKSPDSKIPTPPAEHSAEHKHDHSDHAGNHEHHEHKDHEAGRP